MTLTDEDFRHEYNPLQVPAHFDMADTQENKVIYTLAQLGEGTDSDVINALEKLEPGVLNEHIIVLVKTILTNLFDKGLLTGHESDGVMYYSFKKITTANSGSINP